MKNELRKQGIAVVELDVSNDAVMADADLRAWHGLL